MEESEKRSRLGAEFWRKAVYEELEEKSCPGRRAKGSDYKGRQRTETALILQGRKVLTEVSAVSKATKG